MEKKTLNNKGVGKLMLWTISPYPHDAVHELLAELSDEDLISGFTIFGGSLARICWAEFGRRRGYADFEVKTTVLDGRVDLTFEAEAKAIHEGPILGDPDI